MSNDTAPESANITSPITDEDFKRLVIFVKTKYGIDLSRKRQLITNRLGGVIRRRGFGGFKEYVDHLMTKGTDEDINQLMAKLTTNYTYFMREVGVFDYFRSTILPELLAKHRKDKCLSIWSAGCSTGEEPYNISMYIKDCLGYHASEWDTRILATDLSTDALKSAKAGIYQLPDNIPPEWKEKYFVPVDHESYRVSQEIKDNVLFRQFNLMDPISFRRKFDIIFCRNVMIYFDQPTKRALTDRFYDATAPGGYLVISISENLTYETEYRRVASSVFKK